MLRDCKNRLLYTCVFPVSGDVQFPEELQRLSGNLRTVDLSNNRIETLPAFIGNFQQLKSLTISNNRLSENLFLYYTLITITSATTA